MFFEEEEDDVYGMTSKDDLEEYDMNLEEEEDVYQGMLEEADTDIEGITDDVVSYTYTDISYPCIIIKDGFTCERHKLDVLSHMVKMSSREEKDISLYMQDGKERYKIGALSGSQIKAFYQIIGEENVSVYYSENKELEGDMKYVLCS